MTYERILRQLEIVEYDLTCIENYDEEAYQALDKAIRVLEALTEEEE